MKFQDYYQILGVERSATTEEIQKAFRKLARKYHPDVSKEKGAEEQFKLANEANEVLSDPEKRKRYDALGANWRAGQDFQPPPGFDFGQSGGGRRGNVHFNFQGGNGGQFEFGDFSDFFSAFFGGAGGQTQSYGGGQFFEQGGRGGFERSASPGESHADIDLLLDDVYRLSTRTIALETVATDARGRATRGERAYQVKIPPGTTNGSIIRLSGKKAAQEDLLLKVKILPHIRFRIAGFDLETKLRVAPWEAVLGAKVALDLMGSEIKVNVPAGAKSGQRLRLKGMGLYKTKTERGDVYAEIEIVVPGEISAEERKLYQQLGEISRFRPRS